MGTIRTLALIAVLATVCSVVAAQEGEGPIDGGQRGEASLAVFTEQAGVSLVQIPARFVGKGDLYHLTSKDLEVWVGDRRIDEFEVDYLDDGGSDSGLLPASGPRPRLPMVARVTYSSQPVTATFSFEDECGTSTRTFSTTVPVMRTGAARTIGAPPRRSRPQGTLARGSGYEVTHLVSVPGATLPSTSLRMVTRSKFWGLAPLVPPAPAAASAGHELRAAVIPLGFHDGRFRSRVQLALSRDEVQSGSWDLQLTLHSRHSDVLLWGRVDAQPGNPRVVLQDTLQLPPGDFQLSAVAVEPASGTTVFTSGAGRLPKVGTLSSRSALGEVALFQQLDGAALVSGRVPSTSQRVALAADEPVDPTRDAELVTAVCRRNGAGRALSVEITHGGRRTHSSLGASETPCVFVNETVPAGELDRVSAYRVRLIEDSHVLAESLRAWQVAGANGSADAPVETAQLPDGAP